MNNTTEGHLFQCPFCQTDFKEKDLYVLHLKFQHPEESKGFTPEDVTQLAAFKKGDINVLNL